MGGTAMDLDGAQWGLKGWCVEHVGQSNELSSDVANDGAAAKTRNRDIVGQHSMAARGSSVFDKG